MTTRLRALARPLTEIQILEFASEQSPDDFQQDPRRVALSQMREAAIATTNVVRVEHTSGG